MRAVAAIRSSETSSPEALLLRLKRLLKGGSSEAQLSRGDIEAVRSLLERGQAAERRLHEIQGALDYLIEGCSYPRAIRHRLREIRSGAFTPPAPISVTPRRPLRTLRVIPELSVRGEA